MDDQAKCDAWDRFLETRAEAKRVYDEAIRPHQERLLKATAEAERELQAKLGEDAKPCTHYEMHTPVDRYTPQVCLEDMGRIVTKPIVHDTGDSESPCRCYAVPLDSPAPKEAAGRPGQ